MLCSAAENAPEVCLFQAQFAVLVSMDVVVELTGCGSEPGHWLRSHQAAHWTVVLHGQQKRFSHLGNTEEMCEDFGCGPEVARGLTKRRDGCLQVIAGDTVQRAEEDMFHLGIVLGQNEARVQARLD